MNLGIAGHSVERIAFDFGVTLTTDGGVEIRIETSFTLRTSDGTGAVLDPTEPGDSAVVLPSVLHETITNAIADDATGSLVLDFVHGARLDVLPSETYEAWSITTQDGVRAVALPGGGLSTWGADR